MKTLLVYSNVDGFAIQLKNHLEDALTELQIEWKECHISEVKQASDAFNPTMHIFYHPNQSIYEHLPQVNELKGHKLLWQHEDPYESDLTFDMLPHFYYIFTSDQNTADLLKKESSNKIEYVPHAYNPKIHKPMNVSYEYRSDICFVGNAYESRLKFFEEKKDEYKDKLVTIIGVGYRGLDGYSSQRIIHDHVSEAEMVKYINGAKLVLNLHRVNGDLDMHNKRNIKPQHLNNRFFEVAGIGKPQQIEGRDDCKEFVADVCQNLNEHTYVHRLTTHYLPLLKGIGK